MPDQKARTETPKILYHYTSPIGLSAILHSKHIALTESNLNTRKGNCAVVWLTSSPSPLSHGLKLNDTLPSEYDKMSIRITLPYKDEFRHWAEWSDSKGMDRDYKDALITTAGAEETHTTWYVSESIIPIEDILKIENIAAGEVILLDEALKALSDVETLEVRFLNPIDEYIASQPANLQILLLNVRKTIREVLPDATEKISWQMPTFWQGRNLIHFAAHKSHVGIYPGEEAVKFFAPRLTGHKTSKGAIQFPYKTLDAEQMNFIAEIALWCGKENAK